MKAVFYHVPKNAGTSIFVGMRKCPSFRKADPDHNHVRMVDRPPRYNEYAFAIIRDPIERFRSAFYHLKDIRRPEHFYHNAKVSDYQLMRQNGWNIDHFNDANAFAAALDNYEDIHHNEAVAIYEFFPIFRSQIYWLGDDRGNIHPDLRYIIDYKNLKEGFARIEELTGCKMKWANINTHISTPTDISEETKRIVRKLYADDYSKFNF